MNLFNNFLCEWQAKTLIKRKTLVIVCLHKVCQNILIPEYTYIYKDERTEFDGKKLCFSNLFFIYYTNFALKHVGSILHEFYEKLF